MPAYLHSILPVILIAVCAAIGTVILPATPVDAQEEAAVLGAVQQLFQGMRAADADMVREVLAPDVRFTLREAGGSGITVQSMDAFLEALAGSGGTWEEQIYDVEIRIDEYVASVWAPFTFYLEGTLSHCGTNSIELLRDSAGWKVTQISDTRRTEECPDPLGG